MKTNLSYLIGIAALAATTAGAVAQSVTDPVGYITVNINPSIGPNNINTLISPTLVNKTEYAGASTTITNVANSVISVSGTPFTANQFDVGYYVEITTGANAGTLANIVPSTTTNSITVDANLSANAGESIKIRKHVTVADFFGATNSAGLLAGGDPGTADEVFFINPATVGPIPEVFYDGAAWADQDFVPANDKIISPEQGLVVSRKSPGGAVAFTFAGYVKTGPTKLKVLPGTNVMAVPHATGKDLDNGGLYVDAGGVNGVLPGGDPGLADEVFTFTAAGAPVSHFHDGAAWNDENFLPAGTLVLAEGTAFALVRKPVTGFSWTATAQTIAP